MREFLKGLELDKETIDSIMAEVGKQHTGLKEQIEDLKNEVSTYKKDIEDYKSQIDGLNNTISEKDKSLENLQTLTNENTDLKAELKMSGSNIKPEFLKFVKSEVMSNVKDDIDFETAFKNYKEQNPQYFGETVVKKVQSSPNLTGGEPQPQTTNNIMNDVIRGARN